MSNFGKSLNLGNTKNQYWPGAPVTTKGAMLNKTCYLRGENSSNPPPLVSKSQGGVSQISNDTAKTNRKNPPLEEAT